LDMFLVQDNARMKTLFEKEAGNADICVIEGVMGPQMSAFPASFSKSVFIRALS
jgi:cobyrinic acid a,c-diamide synthase